MVEDKREGVMEMGEGVVASETGEVLVYPERRVVVAGKEASTTVFGTARYAARKEGGVIVPSHENDEQEIELLRAAVLMGFNFIDTARSYGDSEVIIGQVVKSLPREELVIATKVAPKLTIAEDVRRLISESVERLQTPPDLLMPHDQWPEHQDEMEACLTEIDRAIDSGMARAMGVSNYTPEQLEWAIRVAEHPIEVYQAKINLFNPRADAARLLAICQRNGIRFMASSVLHRGELVAKLDSPEILEMAKGYGMTLAQFAVLADLVIGTLPIFQSHNEEHMKEIRDVYGHGVKREDVERIKRLVLKV